MEKKAKELQQRALRELAKPAALMLPKAVRDLIVDLVAIVADLAKGKP